MRLVMVVVVDVMCDVSQWPMMLVGERTAFNAVSKKSSCKLQELLEGTGLKAGEVGAR